MADLHTYEEGLMEKVRALVAPPQSSTATKPRNKKAKPPVAAVVARHGSFENNPYCNACGDGGNLLCCDRCPSSFHFFCCDPPVDPRHLPSGDWLCRHCMALEVDEDVPTLFRPLVEQALASNPLIFHIPSDMEKSEVMPGGSRRLLPHKTAQEREEEAQRACYACSRDFHSGPLVSCDFCPLVFHLDCLDPPLTTPPTSVWMCPMHAHTKTPGFDHPRLTERLQALAESQEDVDHHTVKMDFINKINRIPHHKKLTKHHNRRVTEVPAAVKALYAHPLPDVAAVPSLSNCLLTSEEGVERRRREEQRERREFAAPRQPTFTRDQDEWTRQTILCQLEQNSSTRAPSHLQTHRHHHYNTQSPASPKPLHRSSSPASTTSSPHENDSLSPSASYPDFSVFLAAHKLLELSGRGSLPNGIIRIPRDRTTGNRDNHNSGLQKEELDVQSPRNERSPLGEEDFVEKHAEEANHCGNLSDGQNLIPTETSMEVEKGGSESRGGLGGKEEAVEPKPAEPQVETEPKVGNSKDSTDEREDSSESRAVEEAPPRGSGHQSCDDSPPSVELESGDSDGDDGDSGADAAENPNLFRPGFVPDLNLLDERLVRLLAVQRVQQLFAAGSGRGSDESMSAKSEGMCMDIPEPLNAGKHLNGLRPVLLPKLAKVVFSADALRVAPAILCPVSGIGLAHPFQKVVTSVGTGSDMDVCLLQYGHCNYLSPRHASVFFDKATEEYELINYSDHGSVVDGVLYSCDFSDKGRDDGNKLEPPVFTLDDLTARGVGLRAERARARIEEARKSLEEKEQARRALEGALKLARPSLSTEDSANGGPRNHADSRPVLLGSKRLSDSSVVSIPLSKTKRHCTEESPKRASPQKPSLTKEKGLRSTNHDRDGKAAILKCHEELDCRRGSPSPSKNKTTPSPACSKNKSTPSPGQNKTTPSSTCSKNKNTPSPGKSKNTPSPGKSKNTPSPGKNTSTAEIKSSPQEPSQRTNSVLSPRGELATFSQPCMCKRSASSLVGGNGRGWEGTATLYHGSRLRFGCVQFVLSIAGRPGHGELVKALVELNHRMNTNET